MTRLIFCLLIVSIIIGCKSRIGNSNSEYLGTNDYKGILILKRDKKTSMYAYYDENGNKVLGDYYAAYTDTIKDFGIVSDPSSVLIDRKGKHIYNIFIFDNGPDYTSDGLYRIVENGKIGYVDSITSRLVIKPIYDCAWPFENGKAKVSMNCKTIRDGEHSRWESEEWFYIDKQGRKIK